MSSQASAVEASYGLCPGRTVWTLGQDGRWHCSCCPVTKRYDELVNPVPLSSPDFSVGGTQ